MAKSCLVASSVVHERQQVVEGAPRRNASSVLVGVILRTAEPSAGTKCLVPGALGCACRGTCLLTHASCTQVLAVITQ